MQRRKHLSAIFRTGGLVGAVIIMVSGVTFALLQSQQDTLTGNTIQTATANLQLSTDGTNYTDSHAGFDFNNLIPGGAAVPTDGYSLFLKNGGSTPLQLKLGVAGTPVNTSHVDLAKVNVLITPYSGGAVAQSFTLQSLVTAAESGVAFTSGSLNSFTIQRYKVQVSMAGDAVSGSTASLSNVDFVINGVVSAN